MTSDKDVPPATPGPSFGEELRKEREIRGISLAEIAEATKVSKRFLGAIEKDDFDTLPAPVFTRGFVREYARYLGLNAEEMVTRYAHYLDAHGRAADEDPLPLRSSDKPRVNERSPVGKVVGIIVLILLLIAAGWFAYVRFLRTAPETPSTATPPAAVVEPVRPPVAAAQPARTVGRMLLTIAASQDVWIVLHADGKRALSGTMREGDKRSFEAVEQFEFETLGNAGGVTLTLNGVTVPALGENGQVIRNRVFTREDTDALVQAQATSS